LAHNGKKSQWLAVTAVSIGAIIAAEVALRRRQRAHVSSWRPDTGQSHAVGGAAQPIKPKQETYHEITRDQLAHQMRRVDSLDTKISSTFALTAGLIPLMGVVLLLTKDSQAPQLLWAFYAAAAVVYVLLLFTTFKAFEGGSWSERPKPTDLAEVVEHYDDAIVLKWSAEEFARSIQTNEPRLVRKGRWIGRSTLLLLADGTLLLATVLIGNVPGEVLPKIVDLGAASTRDAVSLFLDSLRSLGVPSFGFPPLGLPIGFSPLWLVSTLANFTIAAGSWIWGLITLTVNHA